MDRVCHSITIVGTYRYTRINIQVSFPANASNNLYFSNIFRITLLKLFHVYKVILYWLQPCFGAAFTVDRIFSYTSPYACSIIQPYTYITVLHNHPLSGIYWLVESDIDLLHFNRNKNVKQKNNIDVIRM